MASIEQSNLLKAADTVLLELQKMSDEDLFNALENVDNSISYAISGIID